MLQYPKDYPSAKDELSRSMDQLSKKGYLISKQETMIVDDLSLDRYRIRQIEHPRKAVVFTIGLHGIEGYVGHATFQVFLKEHLPHIKSDVEIILYHAVNPYGMKHFRRTNEHNVDLNRNFSQQEFHQENKGFEQVQFFFQPRPYTSKFQANISYYFNILKLVLKYGVATMKDATLRGQKVLQQGLYYSGKQYQTSTTYMLEEIPNMLDSYDQIVWFDLHTGYGPRYQMSIVNSQYETAGTKELKQHISYPLILGLNKEDFYDIDGDMIEMIYHIHHRSESKTDLFATCFEFGTLGDSLLQSIRSLKAMIFENACYFQTQDGSFQEYANHLIKEQFLPSADDWKQKAYTDFVQATTEILEYKGLLKK